MGFYATELVETYSKHGSRPEGLDNFSHWMNLVSSVNASFLVRAKARHPKFVTLLNTKWSFFFHPPDAVNRKFLLQVPAPLLQQRLAAIAPLVANGSIDGIDFGDELVAPFSNISAVVAAARAALGPNAVLYMNEGADVFTGGGSGGSSSSAVQIPGQCQKVLRKGCEDLCGTTTCCWWPHAPPELTLVGFDMYADSGEAEVAAVREYAEACVFPSMHAQQRFVAVPGCFAQHNATTTPQLVDAQDAIIADKVDVYAAWAASDARVGGIKPWHWDDRAMTEEGGRFWLGAKSLPKTRKRLEALGKQLLKPAHKTDDLSGRLPPANDDAAATPLLLFASASDLHDSWGLIQHYDNPVQPAPDSLGKLGFPTPTPQCAFSGAKVLYIARTAGPDAVSGPIEMFWVGGKADEALGWQGGVCRSESTDAATWSKPEVVIDGGSAPGALAWMQNAQNMGRRADTGEYLSLIYGNKACAYSDVCKKKATTSDRDPFYAHGALGFVLRSPNGSHWSCDGGFVNGSCDPRRPTTIDHDDGSMTFDDVQEHRWVSLQVVLEQGPKPVLPSGLQFHDNSGGRRVVGFRTSTDGRNWTCVASCGSSKSYADDPTCHDNSGDLPTDPLCPNTPLALPDAPVVRPDPAIDPPELEFYRARPWRYGDRWVAAVYNYAPSLLCNPKVMGCHGPHLGSEWWVQPAGARLSNHSAWERPYAWQRLWRTSRIFGPHRTLNHAPLLLRGQRLWLSSGAGGATDDSHPRWYALPAWRLGGVYAPATGQFTTSTFLLPAGGLALNVDAKWAGGLTHATIDQCDTLHELCQSYVLYELLLHGVPAPGFTMADATPIQGIDDVAAPLRWANSSASAWKALVGQEVALRLTFRDAIIYSLGVSVQRGRGL
jgi:hypothetical protein